MLGQDIHPDELVGLLVENYDLQELDDPRI